MKRQVTLAERTFEIRTADWPFDDDEQYCVELVERQLARFAALARDVEKAAVAVESGWSDEQLDEILDAAWRAAAEGYEFGGNEFQCILELRMTQTGGETTRERHVVASRELRAHAERSTARPTRTHCR
ncbi:MAG: hypothetical protein V4479_14755 [Actinomycetota bacterium]